jgi:hypothetical protein
MDAGPVVTAGDTLTVGTLVNDDPNLTPMYERAVDRLACVSRMALDAGADERRVRMAGSQAADIMRVLHSGMGALVLTPDQGSTARAAMPDQSRRTNRRSSSTSVTAPAAV